MLQVNVSRTTYFPSTDQLALHPSSISLLRAFGRLRDLEIASAVGDTCREATCNRFSET